MRKGDGLWWVHQDIDVNLGHLSALARDMECVALTDHEVQDTPAAWLNISQQQKNAFLEWALLLPFLEAGWLFVHIERLGSPHLLLDRWQLLMGRELFESDSEEEQ